MTPLPLLFFLALGAAPGQGPVVAEFPGTHHKIVLHADYPGDSPEIEINLAGSSKRLRVSVDSGSSFTILDTKVAAGLGLKPAGEMPLHGAGAGEIKAKVVNGMDLDLGGLRLRNVDVLLTDLSGLASQGHSIDGIVGYDLFSRVIVTMSEDEHSLTLSDPAMFTYQGDGAVLPLTFGGGRGKWIYVPGTVKVAGVAPQTLSFFVDSGSSDAVDTELIKKSTGPLRNTQTGNGLGTPGSGVFGRVEWLRLGKFELQDAPSACCGNPGNENMIGGAVLRRFIVTFDYAGRRLILERGARFGDPF